MSLPFIDVANHEGYLINTDGEVLNSNTGKKLKHSMSGTGYLTVYVDGKNELLHRLVAETFLHNPDNLPCVNHKDGNKLNNSIDNLEWCTYSENNLHAYKTGLKSYAHGNGDASANHKLSSKDVAYIRSVYKKGDHLYGATALAKKYKVSIGCITKVVHRATWRCD